MGGDSRSTKTQIFAEACVLGVLGCLLAVTANLFSPRGLSLTRDYFPGQYGTNATAIVNAGASSSNSVHDSVLKRLQDKGLQPAESNLVVNLFHDPRYAMDLVVFVDARDDQHYQEGHIPGAYQFDYYQPGNYLPNVLPAVHMAEQVVVYCTGGSCEDSESTALFLKNAGVPQERLFVYTGGITEWMTNGLPVEVGARKSGQLRPAGVPGTPKPL